MDASTIVLSVLGGLGLLAALSAGLSLGLGLARPGLSGGGRSLLAAGVATLVPMSLPVAGLALEADLDDASDMLLAWLAMAVSALMIWGIVCLPSAWWVSRRLDRHRGAQPAPAGLEAPQGEVPALPTAAG